MKEAKGWLLRGQNWLFLVLLLAAACAPHPRQWSLNGPALSPGRYLTAYYRSPDFPEPPGRWTLSSWELGQITGLGRAQAGQLLQEELTAALADNGLLAGDTAGDYILKGHIQRLTVASPFWRWLSGRGTVNLEVSGELQRQQEVVFAFRDSIKISPPINPRHRPALEPELLARLALRQFAVHLLNEILLPEQPATGPRED